MCQKIPCGLRNFDVDRRFNRIRHMAASVFPWRHIGATRRIRLNLCILPPSPQPKRPIDRFSHFCTAQGRKCLYFTMGPPIHRISPSHGDQKPHLIHNSLGPMRANNPNGTSISSSVFAQMTAECPYTLQCFDRFPLNTAPSHGGIWPYVIHGSLSPPKSSTQMAIRSLQPFLHGSLVW